MHQIQKPLILVTGGTGFIGTAVVRELAKAGYAIRVLTRDLIRGQKLVADHGVELVEANLYEPEEVAQACVGVQAVMHLVGIIHETFGDPFEKVHIEATRSVIAGVKLAGVKRYVHMSALGTRPAARSHYHQSKWLAEEIVRQSGLNWTILRPSLVFGRGDGFVNLFAKLLSFPLIALNVYTFPRLGGGQGLLQPIAVANVAHAFVGALTQEESIGQTYDLCGADRFTLTQILQEIVLATGQKSQVENFPFLTILRHATWFSCLLIPIVALPLAIALQGGEPIIFDLVLLWIFLLLIATRWTTIILFTLPWALAFVVAFLLQNIWIFGKPLLTVDQLLMLQEDNIGHPLPAQEAFRLKLIPFRQGIREYVG